MCSVKKKYLLSFKKTRIYILLIITENYLIYYVEHRTEDVLLEVSCVNLSILQYTKT